MTLIITVEARNHIVITADGRSTGTVESNSLQKIFPDSNKAFAISHHGQNLINERSVKDIANEFLAKNAARIGKSSIQSIAQLFTQQYEQTIRKTLRGIPGNEVCGFLFLGYAMTTNKPKICEAFWETGQATVTVQTHPDLVLSGQAQDHLKKYLDDSKEKRFRKDNILKGTVQQSKAYCDRLYKLAEDAEAKAKKDRFGGHKHQLLIRKSGCEWLIPPK